MTRTIRSASGRRVVLVLISAALDPRRLRQGRQHEASARPSTTARLQTLQPVPNEVTGPDLTVKLNLIGAWVVKASSGKLRPNEGHIHLSVDGRLVSMAYGETQPLHGLRPGAHSLQAEFVATDHQPFANRVVAAVLFNVKA